MLKYNYNTIEDAKLLAELEGELYSACQPSNCSAVLLQQLLQGATFNNWVGNWYDCQPTEALIGQFMKVTGANYEAAIVRLYLAVKWDEVIKVDHLASNDSRYVTASRAFESAQRYLMERASKLVPSVRRVPTEYQELVRILFGKTTRNASEGRLVEGPAQYRVMRVVDEQIKQSWWFAEKEEVAIFLATKWRRSSFFSVQDRLTVRIARVRDVIIEDPDLLELNLGGVKLWFDDGWGWWNC